MLQNTVDIYDSKKWFADYMIDLKKNKRYDIVIGSRESGSWNFDNETKNIILKSDSGTINNLEVLKLEKDTLTLLVGELTLVYQRQ